jgi:predicted nucleic acid-binding protein
MGSRNRLTDPAALVGDTSAVINLNATGCAREILRALPKRFLVVDAVSRELDRGRGRGRADAEILQGMVSEKLIEVVTLDEAGEAHFERLVVGPAAETLDDGEAATIAYAAAGGLSAIIDERKATRLCAKHFPELRISSTVDILCHADVVRTLGGGPLGEAVFRALKNGRMRVLPQHLQWVVDLIGRAGRLNARAFPNMPASLSQLSRPRYSAAEMMCSRKRQTAVCASAGSSLRISATSNPWM